MILRNEERQAGKRQWYHWLVYEATEEEMDELSDRLTEAIGCTDSPDHVCPHFQIGGYRLPRDQDHEDDRQGAYIEKLERELDELRQTISGGS